MAKVIITKALKEEMLRKFKAQAEEYFRRFKTLEQQPHKGQAIGHIDTIVIKELKHEGFRFYFITDGHMLKFGTPEELASLMIKFVRFSEKKDQQKAIDEIKEIIRQMGLQGF